MGKKSRSLFSLLVSLPSIALISGLSAQCAFEQALAVDKRSQGIAQYNAKDYRGAVASLDDYLTVNNRDPYAAYYDALANQQLGNTNKARMMYKLVYSLSPNSQIGGYAKNLLIKLDPGFAANVAAQASVAAASSDKSAVNARTPEEIVKAIVDLPGQKGSAGTLSSVDLDSDDKIDPTVPRESRISYHKSYVGMVVDCQINNRPCQFVLDTGAPGVVIGKNQLRAIGVTEPKGSPDGMSGGATNGQGVPSYTMKATIKLGDIERKDMPITVVEYSNAPPLLGQTFFNKFVITVDSGAGQINFRQKAVAARDSLGGASISVPFTYKLEGNRIMVDVEVNGKSVPMIFDTGNTASACSFLSIDSAKEAGLKIPEDAINRIHHGLSGSGPVKIFKVDRMKLGPIDRSHIEISVNDMVGRANMAPILGQAFWSGYEYTIDMKHKQLHFIRRN